MSKKKRNKEFALMRAESQRDNADLINSIINGETKASAIGNDEESYSFNMDDNEYVNQLSDMMAEEREESYDDYGLEEGPVIYSEEERPDENAVVDIKDHYTDLHKVEITYNDVIDKILIDDGYVSTAIALSEVFKKKVEYSELGPETNDEINDMILYIATCKYPSVIADYRDFCQMFHDVKSVPDNVLFFSHNENIFCYILNGIPALKSIFDENCDPDRSGIEHFVGYMLGIVYACETANNAFHVEDDDEIERVKLRRNNLEHFYRYIMSFEGKEDGTTRYTGEKRERIDIRFNIISLKEFHTEFREKVLGKFEEDDEYEEEDEEDDIFLGNGNHNIDEYLEHALRDIPVNETLKPEEVPVRVEAERIGSLKLRRRRENWRRRSYDRD